MIDWSSVLRDDLEYLYEVGCDPIEEVFVTATATLREYPTIPTLIHVTRRRQPELFRALCEIGAEFNRPIRSEIWRLWNHRTGFPFGHKIGLGLVGCHGGGKAIKAKADFSGWSILHGTAGNE